ncbi:hypothetical protein [Mycolicibacterium mengxianglii]|uniref:hypothetical protein n=1 Tax=Mycolicibacterium mengxianglii TaxID=2736649 RepID=UPI0018D0963C|nr:hypothetical protein [Mycolicibacterium mengxianglii]
MAPHQSDERIRKTSTATARTPTPVYLRSHDHRRDTDFDSDIGYRGESGGDTARDQQVTIDVFESACAPGDHEQVATVPY